LIEFKVEISLKFFKLILQVFFNLIVFSLRISAKLNPDVIGPVVLQPTEEPNMLRGLNVLLNKVEDEEVNHLLLIVGIGL
jgi:hypothetical protein